MDPVLLWTAAIVLSGLFLTAGWHKLVLPGYYRDLIAGHVRMPAAFTEFVRIVLLITEISTGLLLLLPATRPLAAWSALGLLLLYSLLITVGLIRGLDLDCGCSGPRAGLILSPWLLLRNMGLILVAWMLTLPASNRFTGIEDCLIVIFASSTLGLIYLSYEHLLANSEKLTLLRHR